MADKFKKVEFYGLSTCGWCKKTRDWLDEHRVEYTLCYVDQTEGEEKEQAKERILNFVDRLSFPVVIIDDGEKVIQGFKPDQYKETLE